MKRSEALAPFDACYRDKPPLKETNSAIKTGNSYNTENVNLHQFSG